MISALSTVASVSPCLAASSIPFTTVFSQIQSLRGELYTLDFDVGAVRTMADTLSDTLRPHDIAVEHLDRLHELLYESGDPHPHRDGLIRTVDQISYRAREAHANSLPLREICADLGQLLFGSAVRVVRREFGDHVVPHLSNALDILMRQTQVMRLSPEEVIEQWEALSVARGERWVDIGSGNSDSLGRIARRQEGEIIGVDKENSLSLIWEIEHGSPHLLELPPNAHYFLLTWNSSDVTAGRGFDPDIFEYVSMRGAGREQTHAEWMHEVIVKNIGAGTADVVSLLFPYTEAPREARWKRIAFGAHESPLQEQIRTTLALLKPGRTGVMVLEAGQSAKQHRVLPKALRYLRLEPEVASISYSGTSIDPTRLDITPYRPITKGGPKREEALNRGHVVFFTRARR